MSNQPQIVIQITDCHLGETEGMELLSMDADDSLADVLDLVNANHQQMDLLIATGDLANEPSLSAYQRLYQTLNSRITAPLGWLPGNHDAPEVMATIDDDINLKSHTVGNWLFVMLNSRVEGKIYGHLASQELDLLNDLLQQHPEKYAVVCLHHQPVPIGSEWMDNYIVRNANDLWSVIDDFPNVKAVVWGHVHQEFMSSYNGIHLLATPSTCIQFTPGKKHFHVDSTMPGYRWFELYDDGELKTGVERVPLKNYGIDTDAQGY